MKTSCLETNKKKSSVKIKNVIVTYEIIYYN